MTYDIYAFFYAVLNSICWILWLSLLFWIFGIPDKKNEQQIKKIPAITNNRLLNKF